MKKILDSILDLIYRKKCYFCGSSKYSVKMCDKCYEKLEFTDFKADRIINGEDMSRPYLGVSMIDASVESYARQFGITPTDGVIVGSVEAGSPAGNAGLKTGDLIKKMGDVNITNVASLRYELYKYKSGDVVSITYVRNGITYNTSLTLISK